MIDLDYSMILQDISTASREKLFKEAVVGGSGRKTQDGNELEGMEQQYIDLLLTKEAQDSLIASLKEARASLSSDPDVTEDEKANLRKMLSAAIFNAALFDARLKSTAETLRNVQNRLKELTQAGT